MSLLFILFYRVSKRVKNHASGALQIVRFFLLQDFGILETSLSVCVCASFFSFSN